MKARFYSLCLLICCCLAGIHSLKAQSLAVAFNAYAFRQMSQDSLNKVTDTFIKPKVSPGKVALRSTIIPGWGQVTNHQIWKVPIIYAGFGVLAYYIHTNNHQYLTFKNAYHQRVTPGAPPDIYSIYNPTPGPKYSDAGLLDLRETYHRYRDLSIIITAFVYGANVLDAYVSAHLRDFDMSEKLSLQIKPLELYALPGSYALTTGININLRK